MAERFVLTNRHAKDDLVLGVNLASLGTLQMVPSSNMGPNTRWIATKANGISLYRLHVESWGTELSLEVVDHDNGADSARVWMYQTNDTTRQFWRFDLWDGKDLASFRLSNNFTGADKCPNTDVHVTEPFMARGDMDGQHWVIAWADEFHIDLQQSSSLEWFKRSIEADVAEELNPTDSARALISSGTIIGISVGTGLCLICLLAIVVFLCRRKSKGRSEEEGGIGPNGGGEANENGLLPKEDSAKRYDHNLVMGEIDGGRKSPGPV